MNMLLTMAVVFVLGYFTYPLISMIGPIWPFVGKRRKEDKPNTYLDKPTTLESVINEDMELVQTLKNKHQGNTTKKYHLEPKFDGYSGDFDLITKCSGCNMIALYEDQMPSVPCHFCDAEVKVDGAGRWEEIDGLFQWNRKLKNQQID